jgi:acyl carrier protein
MATQDRDALVEVSSVERRVHDLVAEIAPEPPALGANGIRPELDFVDDLAYHSVALVELGFALEEEFDLDPITADDVEHVRSVGDLVGFIRSRLGEVA